MTTTFRALVTGAVVLSLTAAAAAQTGGTPGTGHVALDLTGPPPSAPAVNAGVLTPQPAECLGQPAGPWTVLAPYGWVFGMKGTIGIGRRAKSVDVSVADAVDAAVQDLKGAAQFHVESGYGPVGVIADLTYLRLASGGALATVDSRSTLFELLGMYRVVGAGDRGAGAVTLDVLGGARYYRFSNEIGGDVFDPVSVGRTNKWIDLVVGTRAGVQVTDALGVFARGDVGGFGIGHSSEQACNVVFGFEYRCCECASLSGGYRWLKIDREAGGGRDRFVLDATLHGPFVAFALRF